MFPIYLSPFIIQLSKLSGNYNIIPLVVCCYRIIQLSKLSGNYNASSDTTCFRSIIQLSKLSGNYNPWFAAPVPTAIIQLSKLSGNYNYHCRRAGITEIIQLSKLSGNYNLSIISSILKVIIQLSMEGRSLFLNNPLSVCSLLTGVGAMLPALTTQVWEVFQAMPTPQVEGWYCFFLSESHLPSPPLPCKLS